MTKMNNPPNGSNQNISNEIICNNQIKSPNITPGPISSAQYYYHQNHFSPTFVNYSSLYPYFYNQPRFTNPGQFVDYPTEMTSPLAAYNMARPNYYPNSYLFSPQEMVRPRSPVIHEEEHPILVNRQRRDLQNEMSNSISRSSSYNRLDETQMFFYQASCMNQLEIELLKLISCLDKIKCEVSQLQLEIQNRQMQASEFPTNSDIQKLQQENNGLQTSITILVKKVDKSNAPLGWLEETSQTHSQIRSHSAPQITTFPSHILMPNPIISPSSLDNSFSELSNPFDTYQYNTNITSEVNDIIYPHIADNYDQNHGQNISFSHNLDYIPTSVTNLNSPLNGQLMDLKNGVYMQAHCPYAFSQSNYPLNSNVEFFTNENKKIHQSISMPAKISNHNTVVLLPNEKFVPAKYNFVNSNIDGTSNHFLGMQNDIQPAELSGNYIVGKSKFYKSLNEYYYHNDDHILEASDITNQNNRLLIQYPDLIDFHSKEPNVIHPATTNPDESNTSLNQYNQTLPQGNINAEQYTTIQRQLSENTDEFSIITQNQHLYTEPRQNSCEDESWNCNACTFLNHSSLLQCEMCELPKYLDNLINNEALNNSELVN